MANPATIAAAVSSPLQSSAILLCLYMRAANRGVVNRRGFPFFLHKVFNALVPIARAHGIYAYRKTLAQLTTFKSRSADMLAGYHHLVHYLTTTNIGDEFKSH
eukprot:m.98513 g.98513  ORF g.98513 m.98513 type:complete len:103 (-) comp20571_c0_seq4:601-909(-)